MISEWRKSVDLIHEESLYVKVRNFLPELIPRPDSGHLGLDFLFLLLVAVAQITLIPSLLWRSLSIDLVTPWLIINFIRQRYSASLLLTLFGAAILETHSTVPAGLYLCAYLVILHVVVWVRPILSWRHQMPWLLSFALGALWVITFETLIALFITEQLAVDPLFILTEGVKLPLSVLVGWLLKEGIAGRDPREIIETK